MPIPKERYPLTSYFSKGVKIVSWISGTVRSKGGNCIRPEIVSLNMQRF